MRIFHLVLAFSLVPLFAMAEAKVIFFGGATSQTKVLESCFPGFRNSGYSPGAGVAAAIQEINAHPDQQYLIVGHSSGAANANRTAMGRGGGKKSTPLVNPSRITVIDLDGEAPIAVPKSIKRVCWNAAGGKSGKLQSPNYSVMTTSNGCGEVHTYKDAHCSSSWCLHFSLVNPNAPADLRNGVCKGKWVKVGKRKHCSGRYIPANWTGASGYAGCSQGGMPWLHQ
jgi:hypothetical protein